MKLQRRSVKHVSEDTMEAEVTAQQLELVKLAIREGTTILMVLTVRSSVKLSRWSLEWNKCCSVRGELQYVPSRSVLRSRRRYIRIYV